MDYEDTLQKAENFIEKYKDKIDDFDKEFAQKLLKVFYPPLIANMLIDGVLDKDRISDEMYIRSVIFEKIFDINLPYLQIHTCNIHKDAVRSEIQANRKHSSIILTGVCFEHLLNNFLRKTLGYKYKMVQKDISMALERLRIPDKVGWFFNMTTGILFPEALKGKILVINSIRNKIVHYKAIPEDLEVTDSGSYNEIEKKLNEVDLKDVERLVDELEYFLDSTFISLCDEYKIAIEICNQFKLG